MTTQEIITRAAQDSSIIVFVEQTRFDDYEGRRNIAETTALLCDLFPLTPYGEVVNEIIANVNAEVDHLCKDCDKSDFMNVWERY